MSTDTPRIRSGWPSALNSLLPRAAIQRGGASPDTTRYSA
jgi:hypothetical protein